MTDCACGSKQAYIDCCEPYIKGEQQAPTAEALMRSRYSAFVHAEVAWLIDSVHRDTRKDHDRESIRAWAQGSQWHGLELIDTKAGGPEDQTGEVEFVAHYTDNGKRFRHHELAHFKKEDGAWFFYDGDKVRPKQVVRDSPKVGRNDPCPCGSGKKYKKCCARK